MIEPRKVTGAVGVRWQGVSGRTFETYDEAAADLIVEAEAPVDSTPVASVTQVTGWGLVYLAIGIGGVWFVYSLFSGAVKTQNDWRAIVLLLLGWWAIGGVFGGFSAIMSARDGRLAEWEDRSHGAWRRFMWLTFLGVLSILGLIVAYHILTSLFDGLSKGTIVIVGLLLTIIVMLAQRK